MFAMNSDLQSCRAPRCLAICPLGTRSQVFTSAKEKKRTLGGSLREGMQMLTHALPPGGDTQHISGLGNGQ